MGAQLQMQLLKNEKDKYFLRLRLFSISKPGVISYYDIPNENEFSFNRLLKPVMVAGGSLAEYQNEQYGDNFNPDDVAYVASEALRDLLTQLKDASPSDVQEEYAINVH